MANQYPKTPELTEQQLEVLRRFIESTVLPNWDSMMTPVPGIHDETILNFRPLVSLEFSIPEPRAFLHSTTS